MLKLSSFYLRKKQGFERLSEGYPTRIFKAGIQIQICLATKHILESPPFCDDNMVGRVSLNITLLRTYVLTYEPNQLVSGK